MTITSAQVLPVTVHKSAHIVNTICVLRESSHIIIIQANETCIRDFCIMQLLYTTATAAYPLLAKAGVRVPKNCVHFINVPLLWNRVNPHRLTYLPYFTYVEKFHFDELQELIFLRWATHTVLYIVPTYSMYVCMMPPYIHSSDSHHTHIQTRPDSELQVPGLNILLFVMSPNANRQSNFAQMHRNKLCSNIVYLCSTVNIWI